MLDFSPLGYQNSRSSSLGTCTSSPRVSRIWDLDWVIVLASLVQQLPVESRDSSVCLIVKVILITNLLWNINLASPVGFEESWLIHGSIFIPHRLIRVVLWAATPPLYNQATGFLVIYFLNLLLKYTEANHWLLLLTITTIMLQKMPGLEGSQ